MGQPQKDLYVLVADQDMRQTMTRLLSRDASLGIRSITYTVDRHLQRDSGCRTDASRYLGYAINRDYQNALVVFDKKGCGDDAPREEIQNEVEQELKYEGWKNRAKAIVIDPELEAWVWSRSRWVPRILGWGADYNRLRSWLNDQQLWPDDCPKPPDPKGAMLEAMRYKRVKRTARRFAELASRVSLTSCQDPAFNELRDTLRLWFPATHP